MKLRRDLVLVLWQSYGLTAGRRRTFMSALLQRRRRRCSALEGGERKDDRVRLKKEGESYTFRPSPVRRHGSHAGGINAGNYFIVTIAQFQKC